MKNSVSFHISAQTIDCGYLLEPSQEGGSNKYPQCMFWAQNIDCGYLLEPPQEGGSNEYPQSMFWAEITKIVYTSVNPSFTV